VSEDKSAIVWNYHKGQALRTYLLPELPQALALDPADRAVYVAYSDGSLQTLSFYDEVQITMATETLRDMSSSHRPIQPATKSRFRAVVDKLGAALSLSVSWDGTSLISGHASGKVAAWDAAKGTCISAVASLPGPVTNLLYLEPTGFPMAREPTFKVHTVVKPKHDFGPTASDALVPLNYSLNMQFVGRLPSLHISATERSTGDRSEFEEALSHPSFPRAMLEEGLAELAVWNAPSKGSVAPAADFLLLNESSVAETDLSQSNELQKVKKQLASLQRVQKATFRQLSELREEKEYFVTREREREREGAQRGQRKTTHTSSHTNGATPHADPDVEMREVASEGAASSDSEESDHTDGSDEASSGEASDANPSE
jgi:pre-rRNA-processing protein IPI3